MKWTILLPPSRRNICTAHLRSIWTALVVDTRARALLPRVFRSRSLSRSFRPLGITTIIVSCFFPTMSKGHKQLRRDILSSASKESHHRHEGYPSQAGLRVSSDHRHCVSTTYTSPENSLVLIFFLFMNLLVTVCLTSDFSSLLPDCSTSLCLAGETNFTPCFSLLILVFFLRVLCPPLQTEPVSPPASRQSVFDLRRSRRRTPRGICLGFYTPASRSSCDDSRVRGIVKVWHTYFFAVSGEIFILPTSRTARVAKMSLVWTHVRLSGLGEGAPSPMQRR